jgi:ABC-type antimicrobial peptide transport system permease subunit
LFKKEGIAMLKSYFKVAWRNLLRNKTLSFINIFGLAIGMAFAMLIGMWIKYETSFDSFHKNGDRIGLVRKNTFFNNQKNTQKNIPLPLYDELRTNYPEIKRVTRMDWNVSHSLMVGNDKFNKRGTYVDPSFLKMFSFDLLNGDIETALNDPNSIILTQSLAGALFGKEDPMGKIIRIDNQYDIKVTGIVQDVPFNSTIRFEFLLPFEFRVINEPFVREAKNAWGNNFLSNVVELNEGASMDALSRKIGPLMVQKDKDNNKNQTLFLHPMSKWHLYADFKDWVNVGGKIQYIRLFGIIGIFILLIACINFMNLSTARSEKRAKEVGIRKAVGSRRLQLIIQFLCESMLTAFFAFLVSIGLTILILPALKNIGFEHINFDFGNFSLVLSILGICIITGLIAGSYPSLYLSSFMPVKVLKGVLKQAKGTVVFRKVLVISQFAISIGLIISTILVFQQIQHAKNRPVGYDANNLVSINSSGDLIKNYEPLKQDLLNTGFVESVAKASSPMTNIYNSWTNFSWEGKDPAVMTSLDVVLTELDYEKTVGLKFKEGRPFSKEFKTDSNAAILNEAAVKLIGYKDPVGKTMKMDNTVLNIVGVVENVVMKDPFKPTSPTIILFSPEYVSNFFVRLKQGANLKNSLASMKPIFEKYNPSVPFEYSFVDEDFQKKFSAEDQVARLAGIFAGLAIFISCLGLFGLAMFMAERRIKEIGIRKVLGASMANLWILLSREFVILVMIAFVLISPVVYWQMNSWLDKYDYRINISWWVFAVAGILAVIIALLTVSVQAIKAAIANPVRSLRTE